MQPYWFRRRSTASKGADPGEIREPILFNGLRCPAGRCRPGTVRSSALSHTVLWVTDQNAADGLMLSVIWGVILGKLQRSVPQSPYHKGT